jgi:hypothetical protein
MNHIIIVSLLDLTFKFELMALQQGFSYSIIRYSTRTIIQLFLELKSVRIRITIYKPRGFNRLTTDGGGGSSRVYSQPSIGRRQ